MQRIFTFLTAILILGLFANNALNANNDCNTCSDNDEYYLMAAKIMVEDNVDLAYAADDDEERDKSILENQRIKIVNLGPVINWEGVDYAPTISADGRTLYFVSNKPGSKLSEDEKLSHDFWAATKKERLDTNFATPYNIDTLTGLPYMNVNSELNEGAASIAADRQSIYFTGCNRPDGLGSCDLYKSTIDGTKWTRPINLGPNVNSSNFDSQPSIAPDQSRIYFVSTREGPNSDGKNYVDRLDIWYSDWDYETNEWKPAVNLEALNTEEQEASPFIAADNSTLFFASDGHTPNVGGLDFYVTSYDPMTDSWDTPTNLGKPINTEEDEQFITLPASGDVIYFSSRRKDVGEAQGDLDVYMAFVPTFFRAINIIGEVVDECSQENIPAKITITNPLTGRVVTDSLTMTNKSFEIIVSNTDYGDPKDPADFVNIEISAENPKYGSTKIVQRVDRPAKTEDPTKAKQPDEIRVKLTLGQTPVINAEIDEAEYVKRAKASNPELADYRGLVMEEVLTWDLYPLLNYIFFDYNSSEIPERYSLYDSPQQTKFFADTTIRGGTLDKYYEILNIYGFRLNQHKDAKIKIVGTIDGDFETDKEVSRQRAQNVYDYFKNIWNISEDRMELEVRAEPQHPTSTRIDSIGVEENRRVEIISDNWEVIKPVFDKGSVTFPQPETMKFVMDNGIQQNLIKKRRIEINRGETSWNVLTDIGLEEERADWDWMNTDFDYPADEVPFTAQLVITTQTGAECKSKPIVIPVMQVSSERKRTEIGKDSTQERYSLILFPFDSYNAGDVNEKIMREYVYTRCKPSSYIEVIGHTDVVGMYDHNKGLSENRSETVRKGIYSKTKGNYGTLLQKGVGEEDPLYTNDLPEGRFYNRTVQVIIKTPLSEYKDL